MDLQKAQEEFKNIVTNISVRDLNAFLRWTQEMAEDLLSEGHDSGSHPNNDMDPLKAQVLRDANHLTMRAIQGDLRHHMPLAGILPSEQISYPQTGENATSGPTNTLHLDAFLYTEEEVDDMREEGKIPWHYCLACNSRNIAELSLLSHSMSKNQLIYEFRYLLPNLQGKTLLDVGSRIGAVLYGAFCYSDASQIFGVEINADFCQIQKTMIDKYHMSGRVQVLCDDICNCEELLKSADVVVLNNVFEFFTPVDVQKHLWDFLNKALRKPGVLLITSPDLHTSLKNLEVDIDVDHWVKHIPTEEKAKAAGEVLLGSDQEPGSNELHEVHLYEII